MILLHLFGIKIHKVVREYKLKNTKLEGFVMKNTAFVRHNSMLVLKYNPFRPGNCRQSGSFVKSEAPAEKTRSAGGCGEWSEYPLICAHQLVVRGYFSPLYRWKPKNGA